jgi:hypothetical protein
VISVFVGHWNVFVALESVVPSDVETSRRL